MLLSLNLFWEELQRSATMLDILDTVVKIGFGAIISGGTAILITVLQQKGTIEHERRSRKAIVFQDVAELIQKTYKCYMLYGIYSQNMASAIRRQLPPNKELQDKLIESSQDFFNSFSELSICEAKLLLVGEVSLSEAVKDFSIELEKFRMRTVEMRERLTDKEFEDMRSTIKDKRKALYLSLSDSYKSV